MACKGPAVDADGGGSLSSLATTVATRELMLQMLFCLFDFCPKCLFAVVNVYFAATNLHITTVQKQTNEQNKIKKATKKEKRGDGEEEDSKFSFAAAETGGENCLPFLQRQIFAAANRAKLKALTPKVALAPVNLFQVLQPQKIKAVFIVAKLVFSPQNPLLFLL